MCQKSAIQFGTLPGGNNSLEVGIMGGFSNEGHALKGDYGIIVSFYGFLFLSHHVCSASHS